MDDAPSWEELVVAMAEQQGRAGAAFFRANQLRAQGDYERAVEADRQYREAQASYLKMALLHNRLGYPNPWAIDTIAQPLVQQTLMETDLLASLGKADEAASLREWALGLAGEHLSPSMIARLRRDEAAQLALSGRFNEALTLLAEIQDAFAAEGDVLQSAQTALDQAVVLDWLGDHVRALAAVARAKELVAPRLGDGPPDDADVANAFMREAASILGGEGPTGESDQAAALWRIAVELDEHEARMRKQLGELDEAERLFLKVLPFYEGLGVRAAVRTRSPASWSDEWCRNSSGSSAAGSIGPLSGGAGGSARRDVVAAHGRGRRDHLRAGHPRGRGALGAAGPRRRGPDAAADDRLPGPGPGRPRSAEETEASAPEGVTGYRHWVERRGRADGG